MNELPPDGDGADELYRRASSRERSGPSESVRTAVLRHAKDLAAQRAAAKVAIDFEQPAANHPWRRPAAYGGLAAAVLAGLLVAPHFLPLKSQPRSEAPLAAGAPAASPPSPSHPPASRQEALDRLSVRGGAAGESRGERVDGPAGIDSRAYAGKTSAQNSTRAGQPAASDSALAQIAPPPAAAPSSPPRVESFARRAVPMPAAPAASTSSGAQAARPIDSAAALREAASRGELARVRVLLAEQPNIDARDSAGRSALMLAVLNGRSDAVDLLLAGGADANAADSNGATPLQVSLSRNQPAISDALRRAGAR
jgi:hypothetical protein